MISQKITKRLSVFGKIFPLSPSREKPFRLLGGPFIPVNNRSFCGNGGGSSRKTTSTPPLFVDRKLSRIARAEVQAILSEYLHSTRGFLFSDADYISNNCPLFIEKLLSMVDFGDDHKKVLKRFLRYNPINEFEPFLESIGLQIEQVSSMIPRDHFYLSDEFVLMETFNALCHYGIRRRKIGKIFAEAREVFNYGAGAINSKLQGFEKTGLGRQMIIKLVSGSPSLLLGEIDCIKVLQKFYQVEFDDNWIMKSFPDDRSYNWKAILITINCLETVGYGKKELHDWLEANKVCFLEELAKNSYHVTVIILKLGLKMNEICLLFDKCWRIFSSQGCKNFLTAFEIMREIGLDFKRIGSIISVHMDCLCSFPMRKSEAAAKQLQMKKSDVEKLVRENPEKLVEWYFKSNLTATGLSKNLEKIDFLKSLGYVEGTEEIVKASKEFRGRRDQLRERFECLIEAGLEFDCAAMIVKQAPRILNQSRDVLQKKIECLKNCDGYRVESLVTFPCFLGYDLEKIKQRFGMISWLKQRGVTTFPSALSSVFACSDARFVRYFVLKHCDGPQYWNYLTKLSAQKC